MMAVADLVRSLLLLGIPVGILSWLLFDQLYTAGKIDRDADQRTIRSDLKQIRKDSKSNNEKRTTVANFFQRRWMKFGGGFYGVAALWTFVAIEAGDLFQFITNFPGLAALFADGIIQFLVNIFVNQIQNFVQAMVWFIWWSDEGNSIVPWLLNAYVGYLAGVNLARLISPISLAKDMVSSRKAR
jgi:hypothetical protein